jgi:hypothetical protein
MLTCSTPMAGPGSSAIATISEVPTGTSARCRNRFVFSNRVSRKQRQKARQYVVSRWSCAIRGPVLARDGILTTNGDGARVKGDPGPGGTRTVLLCCPRSRSERIRSGRLQFARQGFFLHARRGRGMEKWWQKTLRDGRPWNLRWEFWAAPVVMSDESDSGAASM